MRLQEADIKIEKSANFTEASFYVGDPVVLFKILRSKMYSIPIKTITQEIMSNARDAHREVGKDDVPIEVQLPTYFDKRFIVRDYGPGISPDRMHNVFIAYGNSTKRDDNVQTGGFGIGAKTPFAYSDTFNIETVIPEVHFEKNGTVYENCMVKRRYIAYIDETEIGKLAQVSEEVVEDELQGTSIIIPCKDNDYSQFAKWVKEVAAFWDIRPVITGSAEFKWVEIIKDMLGDDEDWFMYTHSATYYDSFNGGAKAIVDGIPYSLNSNAIQDEADSYKFSDLRELLRVNLCLIFNTGDVSISATRDGLDYTEKTITTIVNRLKKVQNEFVEKMEEKVSSCKNLWDATLTYKDIHASFGSILGKRTIQWDGTDISLSGFNPNYYGCETYHYTQSHKGIHRTRNDGPIAPDANKMFIIDDNPDRQITPNKLRIKTIFEENSEIRHIYSIRLPNLVLPKDATQKEIDSYYVLEKKMQEFEDVGFSKYGFANISEFEKYKNIRDGNSLGGRLSEVVQIYKYEYGVFKPYRGVISELEGYFVEVNRKTPIISTSSFNFDYNSLQTPSIEDLIYFANKMTGDSNIEVYGVPSRFIHQVNDVLKPLTELINELVNEFVCSSDFDNALLYIEFNKEFNHNSLDNKFSGQLGYFVDEQLINALENKNGAMCQYLELHYKMLKEKEKISDYSHLLELLEKIRFKFPENNDAHEQCEKMKLLYAKLSKLSSMIDERYPLLKPLDKISAYYHNVEKYQVVEYINLIDSQYTNCITQP